MHGLRCGVLIPDRDRSILLDGRIFLAIRYLCRAIRPLMPAHGNAGTGFLLTPYRNQEARQPVFQVVFVAFVDADNVGDHVRHRGVPRPQPRNNSRALGFEMTGPLSAPDVNEQILIGSIVPSPQIPREKPVPRQASLHSLQEAGEPFDDGEAIDVEGEPA